ncbi:IS200/IS605 family transposase [Candidatus Dojkabacteria bacterium]|nr:IS200/IS605 family transposase [Candidatus Dojkabacteria bacterium]
MKYIKKYAKYQLCHATYICRYHIVWSTRWRQQYFGDDYSKTVLKKMFRSICKWKGFVIHGWHIGLEHIPLFLTIPPKYSVSYSVNILKGKTSSWIKNKTKKLTDGSLWNRGYYVSTVGLNEYAIKNYIEGHGKRMKDVQYKLEWN